MADGSQTSEGDLIHTRDTGNPGGKFATCYIVAADDGAGGSETYAAFGTGAAGADTLRTVAASDDPGVVAAEAIQTATESLALAVNASDQLNVAIADASSLGTITEYDTGEDVSGGVTGGAVMFRDGSNLTQPAGTATPFPTAVISALPAGTNNIGDVDISSPLPAGDNNIGNVDIASPLPTGTNSIGQVTANAGTNLNTSALALETGGNLATAVTHLATLAGAVSGTEVQADIVGPLPSGTNNIGRTSTEPATSGGLTPHSFLSTGSVYAASVKASAGQPYGLHFFNHGSAPVHVRLYNQTGAPATTDTPVYRATVPGATAGAGFSIPVPEGIQFATGIGIRVTAGAADDDNTALTANEVKGNVLFK